MGALWVTALRAGLAGFSELGLDVDAICRGAGIDPTVLDDPDGRVPLDKTALIWTEAQKQWQRPGLGLHTGARLPFGTMGAMDYVVATAPTWGEGLREFCEAFTIVTEGATRMTFEDDPRGARITFGGPFPPHVRDYAFAALLRRAPRNVQPAEITLLGPPFDRVERYRELLGACPTFDAEHNAVVYEHDALVTPMPSRFPGLAPIVGREVARLLETVDASIENEVRRVVCQLLPQGTPAVETVARRLSMSPRTLQRRLREERTSLRGVIERTRRELAAQYLDAGRLAVGEIAYLLGYAEPAAFSHAFQRWYGVSPSAYRDGHGAASQDDGAA